MRRFLVAMVILTAIGLAQPAAALPQAAKTAGAAKAKATAANPINLNSASVAQLQTLPGIGASTAQRIVEYRQKNGSFKKIEEILEISRSALILLTIGCFDRRATVSRTLYRGSLGGHHPSAMVSGAKLTE